MDLDAYQKKRNFNKTPEPKGKKAHKNTKLYIVQKHAASHLHYDFRLELNGTLKSWAIPKGPSLDPSVKRLAVHVEDHPLEYGSFEGNIPKGQYGGGAVMLWDKGEWHCLDPDPAEAYKKGHLRMELEAEKLCGRWDLIRSKNTKNWLLIKGKDEFCKPLDDYDITIEEPNSVVSQRSITDISQDKPGLFDGLDEGMFPETISPQLATLVDKPPKTSQWLHEIKFDGYRMLAFKQGKTVQIKSRNHHDWTHYFPSIAAEISALSISNAILDGEIVLLDTAGKSNFQMLQNAIKSHDKPLFNYYIFDCIYAEKYNLKSLPLLKRKNILKSLLGKKTSVLHYSDHVLGDGDKMFAQACELGLEGIVSKHIDSHYIETRSKSWLKVKCMLRQEFVIGGYSEPKGSRQYFGALYLGVFNDKSEFIYCGKVGTGFTEASLEEVYSELKKHHAKNIPFNSAVPELHHAKWVKPTLVAEIQFSAWTDDGRLRHPSFQGLRLDKKAKLVKKELMIPVKELSNQLSSKKTNHKITHANKILYPEDNVTKRNLLSYYEEIAPFILPYITKRPLTLLRCPDTYKTCFYQRHLGQIKSTPLKSIQIEDSKPYIYLDNNDGLFSLVQMGVLEIHQWNCTIDTLEKPDTIVLDLDPAPDVPWKNLVTAAFEIKEHLEKHQLKSFIKTTGGKGLHIVIPIQPEKSWSEVKLFSHVFVVFMERLRPDVYISKMSKSARKGKIFIDYLRNQQTASAVSPYSTRARLHAPVATPLDWDELTNNRKDTAYTIHTLPRRLRNLSTDPWKRFFETKQTLPMAEE